ncbi:type IV pilus modification PilV family protein [Ferrimonas senticii]|uniref:type IV pilus modification PilV family protein n=1 Tax=Ferrimonas senticii TaxID=394566 RepID=UPI0004029D5C|nr:prepilin-type N-terminal cleavage/methylation domain-containing protein [Ferrimonas senticii]
MHCPKRGAGFTLVELVVGITVLAIALTLLATLLLPLAERSADSLHRAKAAQLAQAVLGELAGRPFDEQTPVGGGTIPFSGALCCAGAQCGDPAQVGHFHELDQFHGFDGNGEQLLGEPQYARYLVTIAVSCESSLTNPTWRGGAKLLTVAITTPSQEILQFQQLRGNF